MGGMARGVKAFRRTKQEIDERKERGYSGDVFYFRLQEGEEALVRFRGLFRDPLNKLNLKYLKTDKESLEYYAWLYQAFQREIKVEGSEKPKRESRLRALIRRMGQEEPFVHSTHFLPKSRRSFTCAEENQLWEDIAGCVGCHQNQAKKKGVGRPGQRFGFSVFDFRKMHRVSKGEDEKNEYHFCTADDGKCKWCRRATDEKSGVGEARVNGLRQWAVGVQWATMIISLQDSKARRCMSCGSGKITCSGYMCGYLGCMESLSVESNDNPVRCPTCGKKTVPFEELNCSKCDDPIRGSLGDCNVLVTRAGSGKDDTTYNFQAEPFEEFPEEYQKFQPVDWLEAAKPPSTKEQATLCGLSRDPFSNTKVGSEDYEDDDEESEEEDDDDIPF